MVVSSERVKSPAAMSYRRILITGASGSIGRTLRSGLAGEYPALRLIDIAELGAAGPGEEVMNVDLRNLSDVEHAMQDVDAVIHLGGIATEAPWDEIVASNIEGTYNVYEAGRRAGVKRIIFASSNHVVGFHRRTRRIGPGDPIRPDTRYGVSKAFGEALARFYADKFGITSVCLRIGQFRPEPTNTRMLSLWLSPRDMVELARCSLNASIQEFEIVYGISANTRCWYDNPGAMLIGFRPRDNAEDYAAKIASDDGNDSLPAVALFQGGPFCAEEFDGSVDRIG